MTDIVERLRELHQDYLEGRWRQYEVVKDTTKEAADEIEQLRKALEASIIALDDWLNTYASELCNEDLVKEAYERINQKGTLAYIADVQEANRKALK